MLMVHSISKMKVSAIGLSNGLWWTSYHYLNT